MKSTLLKFGTYSFLTALILFFIALTVFGNMDYGTQEVIGYASIILSLIFIFPGIKHFRDTVNHGSVSFGKAFVVGLLIALCAGIGFAVIDYIFTAYINPDFLDNYMAHQLTEMEKTLPAAEFETQKAAMEQQMKDFGSSGFMAFIMFITVVLIGIIISLISALILKRKKSHAV